MRQRELSVWCKKAGRICANTFPSHNSEITVGFIRCAGYSAFEVSFTDKPEVVPR